MNNRFALPIAIAVAVHAALLLGFRHGPAVGTAKPPPEKLEPPISMPPPEIEIVDARDHEVSKGVPDAPRPDPLPNERPPMERDFTVTSLPPSSMPTLDRTQVSWDPPGDPKGKIGEIDSIFSFASLDNPPSTRVQVSPDYPAAAKAAGIDGEVWVEFIVDTAGRVHDPMVVRSSDRLFDEATLRAVSKWRFEPGKHNGRLVSFRMSVPVLFRLSDK